ncbi:MAG: DUF255 domain-containing protein [Nannocystaceae bacterium]|nr:DUF255 domain-containing protein [Nannocystaceae bacterium]
MIRPAIALAALVAALVLPACVHRQQAPSATVAAHGAGLQWSPWARESFARAQQQERIILVNVVATWCHWCHVMEETTYEDPEVVALLREHFVTIRVDSDARPDVAERYRAWGWPATGFLSPSAQPVLELRGYQNPRAFAKLLRELIDDRARGRLVHREPPRAPTPAGTEAIASLRAAVTRQLDGFYEPELGGWGRSQRYPSPAPLEHAWLRAHVHGQAMWRERALQTLAGMRKLVDPVWGGIYQYSVDGDWDHPHYEKITAIQAGAIASFARAARESGEPQWLAPAESIARYMTTMMRDPAAGFFTSQDADLRVPGEPAVLGATFYARDDAGRRALGIPRIDRAVYADLNGLMIEALCELYAASAAPEHLELAIATAQTILASHGEDSGAVRHAAAPDGAGLLYLRDQVAMGRALLALYRSTGDDRWLARAEAIGRVLLETLQDPAGGFFAHTADPEAVGVFAQRRKPYEENGAAARFLAQLHRHRDGDGSVATPYLEAARRALAALGDPAAVAAEGRIIGNYLLALEEVTMPIVDITVVGDLADGGTTAALHRAALALAEPRAVLELGKPGDRYPDIGKPAIYLCTETACSTPITAPQQFAAAAAAFVRDSLPPSP